MHLEVVALLLCICLQLLRVRDKTGYRSLLRQESKKLRGINRLAALPSPSSSTSSPLPLLFVWPRLNVSVSVLELETLKEAFLSSAEGGVLSRTQLAAVFSDVGFGPVPSDRMFDLFDKDGNGTVSRFSCLVCCLIFFFNLHRVCFCGLLLSHVYLMLPCVLL